jgi:hypothetical protein
MDFGMRRWSTRKEVLNILQTPSEYVYRVGHMARKDIALAFQRDIVAGHIKEAYQRCTLP